MNNYRYFAYGSNMLSRRLQQRTPSARPVSRAHLFGYRLTFNKVSKDGSGKCHIERSQSDHDQVIGVVFEIAKPEKPVLDRIEGLGIGYDETHVYVEAADGRVMEAHCYVGTWLDQNIKPYCWYKSLVVAGAREHGFPDGYVERLEDMKHIDDPDEARRRLNRRILTTGA